MEVCGLTVADYLPPGHWEMLRMPEGILLACPEHPPVWLRVEADGTYRVVPVVLQ